MKEIKNKLSSYGDIKAIADITGFNESYVRKVINEDRRNEFIIKVARELIAMREHLYKKYSTFNESTGAMQSSQNAPQNDLTALINAVKEPSLMINKKNEIIEVNNYFENLIDKNKGELFNHKIHEIFEFIPSHLLTDTDNSKNNFNNQENNQKNNEKVYSSQKWFWFNYFHLVNNPVLVFKDHHSDGAEVVGLEMEEKLYGALVHDIKGKISNIMSITDLALNNPDSISNEELKIFLKKINLSITSLYSVINEVLLWSKRKLSGDTGDINYFYPAEIVAKIVENNEVETHQKNLEVVNDIPPQAQCWGDRILIGIVLRNLISNAIKFTPENGEIKVFAEKADHWWYISIKDSGQGMSEEAQMLVNNKSLYLPADEENNDKSSGIGLFVSQYILGALNSSLSVKSQNGKGSIFTFALPGDAENA